MASLDPIVMTVQLDEARLAQLDDIQQKLTKVCELLERPVTVKFKKQAKDLVAAIRLENYRTARIK